MTDLSSENWIAIIGVSAFFIWAIATFLFSRISVKHIEREMIKEDIQHPIWDKGIGSVIVTYSFIMVFPKLNPTIVDFEAVRRHTRKKDKKLALFFTMAMFFSFIMMFTTAYLYGPKA
mgnify:CR=1 FL=1|jgi:hypothetical protein|tara:strand:- start:417 stop:770 length:354 start_codon:yes stop_codon:yes gene_type:complete